MAARTLDIHALNVVLTKAVAEQDRIGEILCTGGAKSYDEYREFVGRWKALAEFGQICRETAKTINEGIE